MMPAIFTIQAIICLLVYFGLIFSFYIGWLRTRKYHPGRKPAGVRVTVLVPCRNEAENIPELAALLRNQEYPEELLEIIWIDDHSTDGTSAILNSLVQNPNHWHVVKLGGLVSGKKAALKTGMDAATGDLILLTDADSRPNTLWVQTMAKFFEDTGTDLILGPVMLDPARNSFGQIQKLEYLSLVASSMGSAGIGCPIMAQGPNIAVRATDYRAIVNDLNNRFMSGDDVFLLQAMEKLPGKKTRYVLSPDAIVCSKPAKSVTGFFSQRYRWASKASGYKNPLLMITTILVFATSLEILTALIGALSGTLPFSFVLILLGIKTLADFPLLLSAMKFFRCIGLLWWLIPVQLIYPIYIVVAGVLSQVRPVRWK
jgi:poly-beta-1,6-N-acetyl-D-glucosamine synthase